MDCGDGRLSVYNDNGELESARSPLLTSEESSQAELWSAVVIR